MNGIFDEIYLFSFLKSGHVEVMCDVSHRKLFCCCVFYFIDSSKSIKSPPINDLIKVIKGEIVFCRHKLNVLRNRSLLLKLNSHNGASYFKAKRLNSIRNVYVTNNLMLRRWRLHLIRSGTFEEKTIFSQFDRKWDNFWKNEKCICSIVFMYIFSKQTFNTHAWQLLRKIWPKNKFSKEVYKYSLLYIMSTISSIGINSQIELKWDLKIFG